MCKSSEIHATDKAYKPLKYRREYFLNAVHYHWASHLPTKIICSECSRENVQKCYMPLTARGFEHGFVNAQYLFLMFILTRIRSFSSFDAERSLVNHFQYFGQNAFHKTLEWCCAWVIQSNHLTTIFICLWKLHLLVRSFETDILLQGSNWGAQVQQRPSYDTYMPSLSIFAYRVVFFPSLQLVMDARSLCRGSFTEVVYLPFEYQKPWAYLSSVWWSKPWSVSKYISYKLNM